MKKSIVFLTFGMALVLLCGCFTGCSTLDEALGELTDQVVDLAEKSPYELVYTSNGDGTCYVSDIITRPNVSEPYTVEIPETSPDGETVVAVTPVNVLQDKMYRNLPTWILAEDFEALCSVAKQNGMPDFDYGKMTSLYLKLSIEGLDEQQKAELISCFPFAEFADFYVMDTNAGEAELYKISWYFLEYAEFDDQKRYEADCRTLAVLREHLPNDPYDASWHYTAFMEKLVLPASVKVVDMPTSAFKYIVYAGTMAQFSEITLELNGLLGTDVVCSDGGMKIHNQYFVNANDIPVFGMNLTENVTVRMSDTWNGQPRTSVTLYLGDSTEPEKYLMLVEDHEALLVELEQQGFADKAAKYRESMVIEQIGSVEYVTVSNIHNFYNKIALPEDYFMNATVRVSEKTRVTEYLAVKNSKCFTGMELPATLEYISVRVKSFEEIYLTDLYYPGTMEQWAKVQVVSYDGIPWILSGITVHCSDGDVPLALTE